MLVITPVGISSFTNLISSGSSKELNGPLKEFKRKGYNSKFWNEKEKNIIIQKILHYFFSSERVSEIYKTCAELASIKQILEINDGHCTVQLIATDTPDSVIAAQSIAQFINEYWIDKYNIDVLFDENKDVIKGLKLDSVEEFEQIGSDALIDRLSLLIKDKVFEEVEKVINITGGYKVLIPWFTLFAQLKHIEVKYLYEEDIDQESSLITIPRLPVNFDLQETEFLAPYLNEAWLRSDPLGAGFISKEILEKLLELKLILQSEKNSHKYYLTAMGRLMNSFIKQTPTDKGHLGFFMEYKLAYFYFFHPLTAENGQNYNLIGRGIDVKGKGDIDLLFKNEQNKYIIGELKSISNMREIDKLKKQDAENDSKVKKKEKEIYEKLKNRIDEFGSDKVEEIIYFVYRPHYEDFLIMKGFLLQMKTYFLDKLPNSKLRIFDIVFEKNEHDKNTNYTNVLKQNFTGEKIVEITSVVFN